MTQCWIWSEKLLNEFIFQGKGFICKTFSVNHNLLVLVLYANICKYVVYCEYHTFTNTQNTFNDFFFTHLEA